ncbi:mitochondrial hypoxia responsive domain protein [Talaromyces stipitatus ATCC 10500]|uniref:Mitochondrial hypoxia responsive domain protein n=1 Tax=Talaromyces stipitatus (strain ATCC 10500 / CBS 375.48 / QM 6759 / NRRL 1006) TaxID=441959 RepID=B8MK12_TALSN|nr:mitochondrial hypoxia responsive domain protein [Talaromyces stipitatus ATCC 10500]EED14829.1 mitochondrial hypoxia responsive domain protein [Talaromyces stipitatus ATCC 10500]
MKILTKEEEAAHYRAVLQGGTFGTVVGLVGGWAGVMAASRRFHTIRNLTLPMKAFLVTSSGTFVGIVAADHSSRSFEAERNVGLKYLGEREERLRREELSQMSFGNRIGAWAREEKYKIIGATWIASIVGSFVLVGRNPYLSGQQKIVQARVYAQGLTLAVMCASAAFEIHDQRKGQGLLDTAKKGREALKESKNQPAAEQVHHQRHDENTDLWQDMVAAEEQKLKQRHQPLYSHEKQEKEGAVTEAVKAKKETEEKKDDEKEEEEEEEKKEESK